MHCTRPPIVPCPVAAGRQLLLLLRAISFCTAPIRRVEPRQLSADLRDRATCQFNTDRMIDALISALNAKLLDAGVTDDGRPNSALELVNGVPIMEYCDTHKLNPDERLQPFGQTGRAIVESTGLRILRRHRERPYRNRRHQCGQSRRPAETPVSSWHSQQESAAWPRPQHRRNVSGCSSAESAFRRPVGRKPHVRASRANRPSNSCEVGGLTCASARMSRTPTDGRHQSYPLPDDADKHHSETSGLDHKAHDWLSADARGPRLR